MRVIKLSPADEEMRTRDDVLSFFNRKLRQKSCLGKFGLTKGKSNMGGIHRGTLLVFSYKTECMFIARAASDVTRTADPEFPAYFVIDVDSIATVNSSLKEYERALKKKGLLKKNLVRARAWPELSDECEAFTLSYFCQGDISNFNPCALASRAWPILTRAAAERHPVKYGELAKMLGIHHRPIKYVLSEIQDYCLREKLPPLTILVEDQKGNVGRGFIAWDADIETGREKVYNEVWSNRPNPFAFAADGATPNDIARAITAGTTSAKQAYARVKVRGMAQVIFRKVNEPPAEVLFPMYFSCKESLDLKRIEIDDLFVPRLRCCMRRIREFFYLSERLFSLRIEKQSVFHSHKY